MPEQKEMFGGKVAPDNYRKLCEPFESLAAAEKAISGFWDEFYELRSKYKLADVLTIVRVPALAEDGEEGIVSIKMHAGDAMHEEGMAAMAYGQAVANRQERMGKLLAGHVKQRSGK